MPMLQAGRGLTRQTGGPSPSSSFNFNAGIVPAGITFSRASTATRINARGYLEEVAAETLRYDYDPALEYNEIPNPWGDGGDTPPTLPANFTVSSFNGISPQYLGRGVRDGIPYTSWRVSGGPAVGSQFGGVEANTRVGSVPARLNDTFTGAIFVQITRIGPTTTPGLPDLRPATRGWDIGGGTLTDNGVGATLSQSRTFADGPIATTRTMVNAATAWVQVQLVIANSVGQTHDYDFDIGFPTLTKNSTAITNRVPLATLAARVGTTPQYGLLGALIERIPATNFVANPRWVGAVVGTPGTNASTWATMATSGGGINREIVGLPVINGRQCIDVRWTGTASGTVSKDFRFMSTNSIAAAVGQQWTSSCEVSVIAGTLAGVSMLVDVLEMDSGGVQIAFGNTTFAPTAALTRYSHTRTFTQAGAAFAVGRVLTNFANGVPADVTIRYALPQFEFGFMSSPVLPPGTTIVNATRAADIANIDPALIDLAVSTISGRVRIERGGVNVVAGSSEVVLGVGGAGATNSIRMLTGAAGTFPLLQSRQAGAGTTVQGSPGAGSGTFQSFAIGWNVAGTSGKWQSGAVVASVASNPSGGAPTTAFNLGVNDAGTGPGNNTYRFLRIWSGVRLSPVQIQRESVKTS